MNIGGALGTIGNQSLGAYPWGGMVAQICNFHLPVDKQVTLADTGSLVMEKIIAMEDGVQLAILTMDIGNLEGVESSSSRGVNLMRAGAVITGLAMVVIGIYASWDPNGEGFNWETLGPIFEFGKELFKLLWGDIGA